MYKHRKFKPEAIFMVSAVVIVIVFMILIAIGIAVYSTNNHLVEGVVRDKMLYPPTGRQVIPTFVLVVESGDKTDYWYVPESYYNSVHVGSYVKK